MSELRDRFKAKAEAPRRTELVKDVPGIGDVLVQGLSGAEYDEYEASTVIEDGKKFKQRANRPFLLLKGVLDEEGKRLFHDEDLAFLKTLPADTTVPLATAVMKLSGATVSEQESIEKN